MTRRKHAENMGHFKLDLDRMYRQTDTQQIKYGAEAGKSKDCSADDEMPHRE